MLSLGGSARRSILGTSSFKEVGDCVTTKILSDGDEYIGDIRYAWSLFI